MIYLAGSTYLPSGVSVSATLGASAGLGAAARTGASLQNPAPPPAPAKHHQPGVDIVHAHPMNFTLSMAVGRIGSIGSSFRFVQDAMGVQNICGHPISQIAEHLRPSD